MKRQRLNFHLLLPYVVRAPANTISEKAKGACDRFPAHLFFDQCTTKLHFLLPDILCVSRCIGFDIPAILFYLLTYLLTYLGSRYIASKRR